jgi:hypothetical protein
MKSGLNQRSPALTTSAQEQKILIPWISTDRGCVQGVSDQSISKTSQKRHARTTKNLSSLLMWSSPSPSNETLGSADTPVGTANESSNEKAEHAHPLPPHAQAK